MKTEPLYKPPSKIKLLIRSWIISFSGGFSYDNKIHIFDVLYTLLIFIMFLTISILIIVLIIGFMFIYYYIFIPIIVGILIFWFLASRLVNWLNRL